MDNSIQSAKARLGADSSSDHELLIAKFRLELKKVGKTTRPFRYDLNQIPYKYTVEVGNKFKGLDLIDRVPEERWTEVSNNVQDVVTKTIPKKRKVIVLQKGKVTGVQTCALPIFLITKFRLKLKKVGKTTRPFRYGINKIPYNYTVGVTNIFKGLDLIEKRA